MKERRIKQQIYYDILQSILRFNTDVKTIKLTNMQAGSNLAFDKVKQHIKSMIKYNLITKDFKVTTKGYTYIQRFTQWLIEFNHCNVILFDDDYDKNINIKKIKPATIDSVNDIKEILDSLKMQMDKIDDWAEAQEENK